MNHIKVSWKELGYTKVERPFGHSGWERDELKDEVKQGFIVGFVYQPQVLNGNGDEVFFPQTIAIVTDGTKLKEMSLDLLTIIAFEP